MSELFEKSIHTLELPAVLELLAAAAVSDEAKDRARSLAPCTDYDEVVLLQDQTEAARSMLGLQGSPNFAGLKRVAESLARADRGGSLNTHELLELAGMLRCARRVREYFNDDRHTHTAIDHLFQILRGNKFLEEKIFTSILDEEEIADSASPELADIRRHKRAAAAKSRQILQRIISSTSYSKVLQESLITQRNGRFVVPVKAEHRGDLPGLVHDTSSSGATLFVEPMGVVQANNELKELEAKEEKEIARILSALSAEATKYQNDILSDYDALVHLDLLFAKAVPIDISLGETFDTLVITGPNTGGKTVSLKTLGLLTLMAQCGLQLPAASGSAVSVYDRVLADIGDEQSIEQSLSTFSAHMTNIVRILKEADQRTLVLFDELGAGTDPVEGAALAIAVITHVRQQGAKVAATTHYAELKTFAMTTPGVENASCEFDVETLRPTYKLLIGIPGKSNAFAISARLGLPEEVIDTARAQMDSESVRFEEVLSELEQKRQRMEKDQDEAARLRLQREADAKRAREFREQMERAKENARSKGEAEARRIIREARASADAVFAELEELRRRAQRELDWQGTNEARSAIRGELNRMEEDLQVKSPQEPIPTPSRPIQAGDLVELPGTKTRATVLSVDGNKLQLQAGSMKMTTRTDSVRLIEDAESQREKAAKQQMTRVIAHSRAAAAKNELDIRGMMTDEAEDVVNHFIDTAQMGKLNTVSIIHGKGTGALRKSVHQILRRHRAVKSFRLGRYGEGEDGVTIVELK